MGEVIFGVDFRRGAPDPDYPSLPQNFCEAYKAVRHELASLVPFAKSGGPITNHNEYATLIVPPEHRFMPSDPEPAA